jgi:hypothetical protein
MLAYLVFACFYWPPRNNLNIVESGVKPHKLKPYFYSWFQDKICQVKLSLYINLFSQIAITVCLFRFLMVFNTTFNNISVISRRSVLLAKETGGPGENHWPVTSHWQTLSHNVVHLALMVIGTDYIVNPTTIPRRAITETLGKKNSWYKHINLIQSNLSSVTFLKNTEIGSYKRAGR